MYLHGAELSKNFGSLPCAFHVGRFGDPTGTVDMAEGFICGTVGSGIDHHRDVLESGMVSYGQQGFLAIVPGHIDIEYYQQG